MSEFVYYHFPIVTYEQAAALLEGQFTSDEIVVGYDDWQLVYHERAGRFYDAQLDRHADLIWAAFCRENGLDSRIHVTEHEINYLPALTKFANERGLNAHQQTRYQTATFTHSAYPQEATAEASGARFEEWLELPVLAPMELLTLLWEFWFDRATRVNLSERDTLKAMPYQEYISSAYWRRVRAATLLAHNQECMADHCENYDRALGSSMSMHVHHLHYNNRGHERLDNLIVLCPDCHATVHNGKRDIVPAYYEDLDW
jgi:hypothetical protein